MDDGKFIQSIASRGAWLYANEVEKEVIIIEQNYDYWYQLGVLDGDLDEDEMPQLSDQGFAYYYKFSPLLSANPPWGVDSETFLSLKDAQDGAEKKINQKIKWKQ